MLVLTIREDILRYLKVDIRKKSQIYNVIDKLMYSMYQCMRIEEILSLSQRTLKWFEKR